MNENVIQGEININQNKGMNQDNPLNNQLIPILSMEDYIEKAKNIRITFIIPIIILSILEIAMLLISCLILFESKVDSDVLNPIFVLSFCFPISTIISIAIIYTLFKLEEPSKNIGGYVISFLIKGIMTCVSIFLLNLNTLGIILNVAILISFCISSFIYRIILIHLKRKYIK